MRSGNLWTDALVLTLSLAVLPLVGCGNTSSGLPDKLTINLPDNTQVDAEIGTGPASLANTTWNVFRGAATAQSVPFVTLVFDENGGISAFENNSIATEVFGDQILLDGERHPTAQPAVTYAAAVYGSETQPDSAMPGIAFEVRVTGYASVIKAAEANASATGVFDDEAHTSMHGTFSYETAVTIDFVDIPNANQQDTFNFVAVLVE